MAAERRWYQCGVGATGVVGWGGGLLPISDLSGGCEHYTTTKKILNYRFVITGYIGGIYGAIWPELENSRSLYRSVTSEP